MTAAGQGTAEATTAAVGGRFNAAGNDHDRAAARALTSADGVVESTSPAPDGQRCVGQEAIRAAWKPIFDNVASHFTVEDSFTAGPRVVQRWRYDWDGGHVRGIDVITVENGRVTEKLAYVKG
jgi:ketosteroid isomerase-like protein